MTTPPIQFSCPVLLEATPRETETLTLTLHGLSTKSTLRRLFADIPQLTRLACRRPELYAMAWEDLGLALYETPHLTSLHLTHCGLSDVDLLDILQGCPLELCELNLNRNRLKFEFPQLLARLEYFTNLQ